MLVIKGFKFLLSFVLMISVSLSLLANDGVRATIAKGVLSIEDEDFDEYSSEYETDSDYESESDNVMFDCDNDIAYQKKLTSELSKIFINQINNDNSEDIKRIVDKFNFRLSDLYRGNEKKYRDQSYVPRNHNKVIDGSDLDYISKNKTQKFAEIWIKSINSIYLVKGDADGKLKDLKYIEDSEVVAIDQGYRSTLLNILMRYGKKDDIILPQLVQVAMQWGLSKNLHEYFVHTNANVSTQSEFPLKVSLDVTKWNAGLEEKEAETLVELRSRLLRVFFDRNVLFSKNDMLPNDLKNLDISETLKDNIDAFLTQLVDEDDYYNMSLMLGASETYNISIFRLKTEEMSGEKDQYHSPVFEKILDKLKEIRVKTTVGGEERVDTIGHFLNHSSLRHEMSQKDPTKRFDLKFQKRLDVNYGKTFETIANYIDQRRDQGEMKGSEFGENAKEYARLMNMRNRFCVHFNKYLMSLNNNSQDADFVKAIRYFYAVVGDVGGINSGKFSELMDFDGMEIIMLSMNRYLWTPFHFSVLRKNSNLFTMAVHILKSLHQNYRSINILHQDGIGYNLMHYLVTLPDEAFKRNQISKEEKSNPLVMVGDKNSKGLNSAQETVRNFEIMVKSYPYQEQIVESLLQISSRSTTPVYLAAHLGFVRTFEAMKNYLSEKGQWQPEIHGLGTDSIYEILKRGAERRVRLIKESTELQDSKFNEDLQKEIKYLERTISEVDVKIKDYNRKATSTFYDPEIQVCGKVVDFMRRIVDEKYEAYKKLKSTEQKENIIKTSLDEVIQKVRSLSIERIEREESRIEVEMSQIKEKVNDYDIEIKKVRTKVSEKERALQLAKANLKQLKRDNKRAHKVYMSPAHKQKGKLKKEIEELEAELRPTNKHVADLNFARGKSVETRDAKLKLLQAEKRKLGTDKLVSKLNYSSPKVIISYLRPILEKLLDIEYKNGMNQDVRAENIYVKLTESKTYKYFYHELGKPTLDDEVINVIREVLKEQGRLDETAEDFNEEDDTTAEFNDLVTREKHQKVAVDLFGEGKSTLDKDKKKRRKKKRPALDS